MAKILKLDLYKIMYNSTLALEYEEQFQQCTTREKLMLVLDYHFYIQEKVEIEPNTILKGAVLMQHLTKNAKSPAMKDLAQKYKPILEKYYQAKLNQNKGGTDGE